MILISPLLLMLIVSLLKLSSHSSIFSSQNDFLYRFIKIYFHLITIISFLFFGIGPDIGLGASEEYIRMAMVISLLLCVFIIYIFSCIIALIWNKLSKRIRSYSKIVATILIFLYVFLIAILPVIESIFIVVNKNTPENISINKIYEAHNLKLQEIIIQNNFALPIKYELPGITACLYDVKSNTALNYLITYKTDNDRFIQDMDKFRRAIVTVPPHRKTRVYLQTFASVENYTDKEKEKYDELLLVPTDRISIYGYCKNINSKDILNAKKIKIIKQPNLNNN
ncbi:MAG: hypothetical protein KAS78_06345 [Candidatus Pacebacteria bacterium]|nr:hypothetical protein [Candidatus Paceibacterota bacterium]